MKAPLLYLLDSISYHVLYVCNDADGVSLPSHRNAMRGLPVNVQFYRTHSEDKCFKSY